MMIRFLPVQSVVSGMKSCDDSGKQPDSYSQARASSMHFLQ